MYTLDNKFASGEFAVTVVGCGGTGGFVAEGLCRFLPVRAQIVLIDHDRVEESNLGRSNFKQSDLGKFKSEALALRLAREYNRKVVYSTFPVAIVKFKMPGLAIGCVDNGPARKDIATNMSAFSTIGLLGVGYVRRPNWWIDSGNGDNYGQVIIGNTTGKAFEDGVCFALPTPIIQRPDLLQQVPERRDCSAAIRAGEQGPTINQAMAALVLEVVRRLIEGTCHWTQLYLDLSSGTLSPSLVAPDKNKRKKGGEPCTRRSR